MEESVIGKRAGRGQQGKRNRSSQRSDTKVRKRHNNEGREVQREKEEGAGNREWDKQA